MGGTKVIKGSKISNIGNAKPFTPKKAGTGANNYGKKKPVKK